MDDILCHCSSAINIARGSTFSMTLTLPPEYQTSNFLNIWVTFEQNGKIVLNKEKLNVGRVKNTITVTLSQAETLKFRTGRARMQMRALTEKKVAIVQEPITELNFLEILKEGEI